MFVCLHVVTFDGENFFGAAAVVYFKRVGDTLVKFMCGVSWWK